MESKNITVVVALWTLLLVPLFCGLGVVVHLCFDNETADCCQMECDQDPCQELALATSQRGQEHSNTSEQLDQWNAPLWSGTNPASASDRPTRSRDGDDSRTELTDCQRSLPLIC